MSDDEIIAWAVLAGCQPVYDDYGHPERAMSRQYWTAQVPDAGTWHWKVYAYTRVDCAKKWLKNTGRWEALVAQHNAARTGGPTAVCVEPQS